MDSERAMAVRCIPVHALQCSRNRISCSEFRRPPRLKCSKLDRRRSPAHGTTQSQDTARRRGLTGTHRGAWLHCPPSDLLLISKPQAFQLGFQRLDALVAPCEGGGNLGFIRRVVCASPAYFAPRGTPKSPTELGTHDCITFDGLASPEVWSFNAGKPEVSVGIHSRLVVNTAEAAIDVAIAGLSITRVLFSL